MYDYFKHFENYKNQTGNRKRNRELEGFIVLISSLNTPIHELESTFDEYKTTLKNPGDVEKYVKWMIENDK